MTFNSDLFDLVTADVDLSARIGTRFYWEQIEAGASYPAARYIKVARPRTSAHDGPSGLETNDIQIDIVGDVAAEVLAAADEFKALLDGFKSGTLSGFMTSESDDFEDDDLWRITQEYTIHHAT